MGWLHQLQSDSNEWLERTGLPRRVLRHLIFAHEVGVGSRVLIAGCGDGELVRFFDRLGFPVVGLDESSDRLATAEQIASHLEFVDCPQADQEIPLQAHQFDLVLVRDLGVYRGTLFCRAALRTTANLLACVRPGGHLVILARYERTSPGETVGHTGSCFIRHLSHFPGPISTADFPDRLVQPETFKWIPVHRPYSGLATATIASPRHPLSRADWLRRAETASVSPAEFCCTWSLESTGKPTGRPAA